VLGAVMASVRALTTRFIAFDTAVVDLSEHLSDPSTCSSATWGR